MQAKIIELIMNFISFFFQMLIQHLILGQVRTK